MQFKSIIVLAMAIAAQAKVIITNTNFSGISTGTPFTITWADATGPVTITLKSGASNDLKTVGTITTGATGTSFVWTPDSSITDGTYAFEITDGETTNYSSQFVIDGTASVTISASSTASETKTTSSSSVSSTHSTSTLVVTNSTTTTSASSTLSTSTSSSSKTTSASSSSASASSTTVANANGSQRFASSLALVIGAVAAFVAFN